MNNILDFIKDLSSADSEISLDQILIISRVLFAVVMVGFIGYFFDRTKENVKQSVIIKPKR